MNSFKVAVVGASGVGKTAIIDQLRNEKFTGQNQVTLGVEFHSHNIAVNNDVVELRMWDVSGQEVFRPVVKVYIRNSAGVVLVFDVTDRDSFDAVNSWINLLETQCADNVCIFLVGNKADLYDQAVVTTEEAEELASRYNLEYFETSAQSHDEIHDLFTQLVLEMSERKKTVEESESTDMRLTAKRLGEAIAASEQEKRFTFVVGKGKTEYTCTLTQACFISGKVCRLVSSDPSTNLLRVLPNEDCSEFGLLEHLWNGESIRITEYNVGILYRLGRELENEELVSLAFKNEELSVGTCISRLESRSGLDSRREIEFISSHFSELQVSDLSSLGVGELESILTHESFRVESENLLMDYIQELCSLDESYSCLLRYVQFEYLDLEHLNVFLELVYPDRIDAVLWQSIAEFIVKSMKRSPPRILGKKRFTGKENTTMFEYNPSDPLTGIMSHLRDECGGNPHVKGVINITASSTQVGYDNQGQCHEVIDYGSPNYWSARNIENSWIQFDFKDASVVLHSYTIKTTTHHHCHPQKWKIEGSDDGILWTQLDRQNTRQLDAPSTVLNFICSTQTGNGFRFIRLTETGCDTFGGDRLQFSEIEFFGALIK